VLPVIEAVRDDLIERGRTHGLTSIATQLNRLGVRSYQGKRWSQRTVGRLLRPKGEALRAAARRAEALAQKG
jgi:hypothetical protein